MNGSDCAWCGTGEGMCRVHQHIFFIESKALAATGDYLAPGSEKNAQHVWSAISRTTRGLARAYVRLRKFHAHSKAQRTLRWRLKRAYQAQATEVEL